MKLEHPPVAFEDFKELFFKEHGVFKTPLILFIDEFDSLPPAVIDRLVILFRDIYLKRESYLLHGLALIGVRAISGVESLRGSPFNVQRSLQVPKFTPAKVTDLFDQYQAESGQTVEAEVVQAVYDVTCGQPGLVRRAADRNIQCETGHGSRGAFSPVCLAAHRSGKAVCGQPGISHG